MLDWIFKCVLAIVKIFRVWQTLSVKCQKYFRFFRPHMFSVTYHSFCLGNLLKIQKPFLAQRPYKSRLWIIVCQPLIWSSKFVFDLDIKTLTPKMLNAVQDVMSG